MRHHRARRWERWQLTAPRCEGLSSTTNVRTRQGIVIVNIIIIISIIIISIIIVNIIINISITITNININLIIIIIIIRTLVGWRNNCKKGFQHV